MFVSVRSYSNVSDDPAEDHRADILEFNPDGTGERIYAAGIRNVGVSRFILRPASSGLPCTNAMS